jgi:hypothetical protein
MAGSQVDFVSGFVGDPQLESLDQLSQSIDVVGDSSAENSSESPEPR